MTPLQKVELDILKEVICVCEELKITYYLVCGSALGAAKYQGFIPWDDDIDIALSRADYEIFCERAQELLPKHLFVQNHLTDPGYPMNFAKVRDSRTTYIEKSMSNIHMHHGVYIDVFPLDGYPKDSLSQNQVEKEKKRYVLYRLCCLNVQLSWKASLFVKWLKFRGVHRRPEYIVQRVEDYVSQYSLEDSELWCNHGNWQGKLEYAPWWHYGEGVFAVFEGLQVRIPKNYDAYLTQKYGDWRADIPENQQVGHHYYEVCDLQKSYTEYIGRDFAEKKASGK